jgi:hypothetical protein
MNFLLRNIACEKSDPFLWAAIDELAERYWIRLDWRTDAPHLAPGTPRPLDHIDRLTATRFGKRKNPAPWSTRRRSRIAII